MSFDQVMEGFFDADKIMTVDAFGGLNTMLENGGELGRSQYADHYFDLIFPYREKHTEDVDSFLVELLISVKYGPELSYIVDKLFGITLSSPLGEQRLFRHFLKAATNTFNSVSLRVASLKGALAFLNNDNVCIVRMIADISDTDPSDDPIYIAHAARIAGILSGQRTDPALVDFLNKVRGISGCADQVDFELGLVSLREAIHADNTLDVAERLESAQASFSAAVEARETRYEARIYSLAISILLELYSHRIPVDLISIVREMRLNAFAYAEYSGVTKFDPMLGSIAIQSLALIQLSERLEVLLRDLDEDFWLEAASVIENQLVLVYSANRTVFGGRHGHGVDCVVRPYLEPRIFGNHHHAAALHAWLRSRSAYMTEELVKELNIAVRNYFEQGDALVPMGVGFRGPLSPALEERVRSTDPQGYSLLADIAAFAVAELTDGISVPLERALNEIDRTFVNHIDYRIPSVRNAFLNLLFHLLTFLERKLNNSFEQDKFSAYLFERDGKLPLEEELQQDVLRHCQAVRLSLDDEVRGVGGGRADIRYKATPHEFYVEVKRELSDASFDNLIASYGDQTVLYQTTNVKLGVLLVLDLTQIHAVWPDFEKLYETRVGDFLADGTVRGVVIIKVPGRRGTPSNASSEAKTKKGKERVAVRQKLMSSNDV
ncbi:MAG TPA: hypothetical protein VG519_04240 [Pseudochrobactrum sp.]|nr:hypothetical protein [Pseudochrobactrum sp.]